MNVLLKIGFGGTGMEMAGKKVQYLCSTLSSSEIKDILPSTSAANRLSGAGTVTLCLYST